MSKSLSLQSQGFLSSSSGVEWREGQQEMVNGGPVQYNYPGTFQSRYVKLAHCAAADNVTADSADGGDLRTRDAQNHHFKAETHDAMKDQLMLTFF